MPTPGAVQQLFLYIHTGELKNVYPLIMRYQSTSPFLWTSALPDLAERLYHYPKYIYIHYNNDKYITSWEDHNCLSKENYHIWSYL